MRTYRRPAAPPPILLAALLSPALAAGLMTPTAGSAGVGPAGTGSVLFRSVVVEAAPVAPSWRWPLPGVPRVARRFDPPPVPWQSGHRGVDLEGPAGAPVRTAGPGVVLFAERVAGTPVVSVSHTDGLRTTYQPVEPSVRPGDRLTAGETIGALLPGHPGCPSETCLHWGLRRGEHYLDPLALLGLARVRLLPVTGVSGRWRAGRAGPRRAGRTPRPGCRPAR